MFLINLITKRANIFVFINQYSFYLISYFIEEMNETFKNLNFKKQVKLSH